MPSIVSSDTSIASDDYNKACLFNTFFYTVFTRSSFQIPPLEELPSPASSLSVIGISELDVLDALSSLDSSKAMGMDGIGPKVLYKTMCSCSLQTHPSLIFAKPFPAY